MPSRLSEHFVPARSLARAGLLCLILVLAACGGDDEPEAAEPEAAQPDAGEPEAVEPKTPEVAADQASSSGGSATPSPSAGGFSLNGFRYCEILVTVDGEDGVPVTEVWGTPGVGTCEDEAWYALDPDEVMADFEATSIHMNGPRYFTVDGFAETSTAATDSDQATESDPAIDSDPASEVRDVGGISMTLLATVPDAGSESTPYQPGLVERTVTMAFNAGTEVYELTDPDANTYVMQSYALIHDRDLTAEDLASLGDRLELPDGWSYRTRILEENLQLGLTPDGAVVVQDELENSYQRNVIEGDGATENAAGVVDPASCDAEPVTMTTASGVEFVRTPDACFASLPDWPYEPQYVEIDGLRQAYVDEGGVNEGDAGGEVVLLLHGQPSWSYLYRDMIPVLSDAGYRVIAMDHLGMGRSDKPTDLAEYSYLGHNQRLEAFIDALGLTDINLFVQDWGSLIGLRVAGLNPNRFATIAVGDGALPVIAAGVEPYPPVENPDEPTDVTMPFAGIPAQQVPFYDGCEPSAASVSGDFGAWMTYAQTVPSFRPSEVIEALTWYDLAPEEEAAYDAPFPSRVYMGGPRTFPSLVNEVPGTTAEAWQGLTDFAKPFLTLWAANDPGSLGRCETQQHLIDSVPGAEGQPHDRLAEASHFLQDDQGTEIAGRLVNWYAAINSKQ